MIRILAFLAIFVFASFSTIQAYTGVSISDIDYLWNLAAFHGDKM